MPSFEVLLPIGAIGFYLFDAALLLYGNEFILVRARRHWRSAGGRLQIMGRRLYLPNPFTPGRLLIRSRWDDAQVSRQAVDVEALAQPLRPLSLIVSLQVFILVWLLPPTSVGLGAGNFLLVLFAAFYLLTAASTLILVARRKRLGLTDRQTALFALEGLLCAPFAPNLVRKISCARSADVNWLEVVRASLDDAEKQKLVRYIGERIDEGLAIEDPGSARSRRLQSLRDDLKERLHVAVSG